MTRRIRDVVHQLIQAGVIQYHHGTEEDYEGYEVVSDQLNRPGKFLFKELLEEKIACQYALTDTVDLVLKMRKFLEGIRRNRCININSRKECINLCKEATDLLNLKSCTEK
jgi:hypothetical protein